MYACNILKCSSLNEKQFFLILLVQEYVVCSIVKNNFELLPDQKNHSHANEILTF